MIQGHDVIWALLTMGIAFGWIVGAFLLALFVVKFKPTRRLINKYISFELY